MINGNNYAAKIILIQGTEHLRQAIVTTRPFPLIISGNGRVVTIAALAKGLFPIVNPWLAMIGTEENVLNVYTYSILFDLNDNET